MKEIRSVTVKIGSNVLSTADGKPNLQVMQQLVDQIQTLHQKNIRTILVSSGAVAVGKGLFEAKTKLDQVAERQLFSAIGQTHLIQLYRHLFSEKHLTCAQVLATRSDFDYRGPYTNMQSCLHALLDNDVIPIINENDTVSISELMFTDNDELATLIASMMHTDILILLTSVDGIYTGDPTDAASVFLPEIGAKDSLDRITQVGKSSFGRGGMLSKVRLAQKAASLGIETYIANGSRASSILDVLNKTPPFTHFPAERSQRSAKRKLAWSDPITTGAIVLNEGAEEALRAKAACSILPVGVVQVESSFDAQEIIAVKNIAGKRIAVGRAAYSSHVLEQVLGQRNQQAIIHYDYLYAFH